VLQNKTRTQGLRDVGFEFWAGQVRRGLVAGAGLDENATQRNRFVKEINKYHVMLRGLSPFHPLHWLFHPRTFFSGSTGTADRQYSYHHEAKFSKFCNLF